MRTFNISGGIASLAAVLLLLVPFGRHSGTALAEDAITPFTLRIPFTPGPDTMAFFVAESRYWPKTKLAGTIHSGKGSAEAVESTGTGTDQLAVVDFSAAINGLRSGVPITIIAAEEARDASGVIFTATSGVHKLADLVGKRVGFLPGAVSSLMIRAALRKKGIDPDSVDWQTVPAGAQLALLKAGTLQVATGYAGAQDVELGCEGVSASSIHAYDLGVKSIGQVIIVNNDWAEKVGRNVISDILLGAFRGFVAVKVDPAEAVNDMIKMSPNSQVDLPTILSPFDEKHGMIPWVLQPLDKSHGFGWVDAAHITNSISTLEAAGILKGGVHDDVAAYFTTKYLTSPAVRAVAQDFVKHKWGLVPPDVRRQCGLH